MGSKRADFAAQLARRRARRRAAAKLSLADLPAQAHVHRGYLHNVEHGRRWPGEAVTRALDAAVDADGALLATWDAANRVPRTCHTDGQLKELLELAARAEASDVGSTTLDLLDLRVDEAARAYTRAPPAEL
ncbi:MAG: helix-turn-helix domain-containing protein, partial [Pseudonocardiaceae bacterium]